MSSHVVVDGHRRSEVGGTLLLRTDHRHLRLFHPVAGLALCGWHVWETFAYGSMVELC